MSVLGIRDSGTKIVTTGLILNYDAAQLISYGGSGTNWGDLSGNADNGTLVNGPTFNSNNGGSIVFDGTNDYGNSLSNTNTQIAPSTGLSMGCWMYPDYPNFDTQVQAYIMYRGLPTNAGDYNYGILLVAGGAFGTTGRTFGVLSANGVSTGVNGNLWNDKAWQYLSYTHTSTTATVYINGVSVGSYSGLNSFLNTSNTSYRLAFGSGVAGAQRYTGRLGVIQMYNRALSATEMLQNYNAGRARYGL